MKKKFQFSYSMMTTGWVLEVICPFFKSQNKEILGNWSREFIGRNMEVGRGSFIDLTY